MKSLAHEIHGLTVHAADGEIGSVKDVVFDVSSWRIHFLEVDTGWLFGRDVLVPVEKIVSIRLPEGGVTFDLTKDEIEKSPAAKSARPAEEHYDILFPYFGIASPWGADIVALERPEPPPPQPMASRRLIFARDLDGYDLEAQGEQIGTVRDVLVDLEARRVTSLSADLGGLMTDAMSEIKLARVVEVDPDAKVVRIRMRQQEIDEAHQLSPDDLPYILPYIPPIL